MPYWSLFASLATVETGYSARFTTHYQPNHLITTTMQATGKQSTVAEIIAAANQIILGKEPQIRLA